MEPLTSSLTKGALSIGYRMVMEVLKGTPLFRDLSKAADRWRDKLPPEADLPDVPALLGITTHGPNDTGMERQRRVLEKLAAFEIPTVEDWEEDLFVRWEWVREQPGERAAFFTIPPEDAQLHIKTLAINLHQVCTASTSHFQYATYELIHDAREAVYAIKATLDAYHKPGLHSVATNGSPPPDSYFIDAAPDIGHELELAVKALEDNLPDVAITRLTILREQHWASLTNRDRYRLVANIGFAHLAKEETTLAAHRLIDARRYDPDNERSRTNEVIGYGLLGDIATARRLAETLVTDFPTSDLAHASNVRYLAPDFTFEEVERTVPAELKTAPETCYALAFRALRNGLPDIAEQYARGALSSNPQIAPLSEVLCYALIEQVRRFAMLRLSQILPDEYRSILDEVFTRLVNILNETPSARKQRIAVLRYNIGYASGMLSRSSDAELNFRLAYESNPDDADYARQYAGCLLQNDDYQRAIAVLRESADKDTTA